LNNFIRKRVTAKSNDFTSLLFNGQHSKPYNKIGKHLHLTNSRTASSEATLPIFPKIALVARKKSALGLVQRALERPWFDKVHPEVPNFLHPWRGPGPTRKQDDFLPRDAMHKRSLCCHAVSVCPFVRPSRSWITSKQINISSKFFQP